MMEDILWIQRFKNFQKTVQLVEKALNKETLSELERAGLIQFYEVAFELAWKTLKDFLQHQGYSNLLGPKDIVKKAFQNEIIQDGETWLKALDDRNLTVHTYHESIAIKVEVAIKDHYFDLLKDLENYFSNQMN